MNPRSWALGMVLAGGAAACDVLVEPSPGASADVRFQVEEVGDSSVAAVLNRVESASLRFEGGGVTVDTTVWVRVEEGQVHARLVLDPLPGSVPLTVRAQLLASSLVLFEGRGTLSGRAAPSARIFVRPIANHLMLPGFHHFDALGGGVQLWSEVYFATGDRWHGVDAAWSSENPDVVEVEPGPRAVPRSNGVTTLAASFQHLRVTRRFSVRQVPRLLTGVGPVDTTVAVGDRFTLRVFGEDLGGHPLLPGADVQFVHGGGVEVDTLGVVTAVAAGPGFVHAVLGATRQSATITVLAAPTLDASAPPLAGRAHPPPPDLRRD